MSEEDEDELEGADIFAEIREEPGNVSVKSIEREAFKLGAIRAIALPEALFADIAAAVLLAWRSRVAAEAPSHLREHPDAIKVTLLAAYLHCRQREIIDALVDLLITTVHRINVRADTVVTKEFISELKRISGKENILFKMTRAALRAPEETVSDVIYPAAPGGADTLVALLHEYTHKGSTSCWRRPAARSTGCAPPQKSMHGTPKPCGPPMPISPAIAPSTTAARPGHGPRPPTAAPRPPGRTRPRRPTGTGTT
ncbi:hypothetical protein [Streptosporangium sandarakinum]|uniref:hypothetical protein n=1 Tax=Streptosporangium sandarakinum TaxID=1260955 RepID=UPI0034257AC2